MIPFLFKSLLLGGAGWGGYNLGKSTSADNDKTDSGNIITSAFDAVKDKTQKAASSIFDNFDVLKLAEDHWGKAALGTAALGAIKGSGTTRNLSIGVLLVTALYFGIKHFFDVKDDFNKKAGVQDSAPVSKTNLNLEEPEITPT